MLQSVHFTCEECSCHQKCQSVVSLSGRVFLVTGVEWNVHHKKVKLKKFLGESIL